DPDRGIRLHHPPRSDQPGTREGVIGLETRELVPFVIDSIDQRMIGAVKGPLKLKIIGWIGENEIDRGSRKSVHLGDAIANDDTAFWDVHPGRGLARPGTQYR